MNSVRRTLSIALDVLGDTADDVADVLTAGGWKGLRNDPSACPVAVYLKAVVPNVAVATVSVNGTTLITTDEHTTHMPTPHGPAEFVAAFDNGEYDELAVSVSDTNGDVIDDLER